MGKKGVGNIDGRNTSKNYASIKVAQNSGHNIKLLDNLPKLAWVAKEETKGLADAAPTGQSEEAPPAALPEEGGMPPAIEGGDAVLPVPPPVSAPVAQPSTGFRRRI